MKRRKFPALLALSIAYLYRKKRSPFWHVQFVDSDGKRRDRSTGLRADDPNETAKSKSLRAELESKEHLRSASARNDTWDTWVMKFQDRHCQTPRTHERYVGSWRWLSLWLSTKRVHSPRQLTYRMAVEYIDWRTGLKRKRGKTADRNTAIMELKILALVMGEAVRLGFADANPLVSMKLRRDKPKKKPEMTDEEIVEIRRLLADEPEWMQISFEIALHTGCRLRETRIPADCLDFKEKRITFPTPKGGDDRAFSIPMPSALEPVLKKIKKSGRSHPIDFPFQPSRRWQQFFIKIKKRAPLLSLPASQLRESFETSWCSPGGCDTDGEPFIRIGSPDLPTRIRCRYCSMARCRCDTRSLMRKLRHCLSYF